MEGLMGGGPQTCFGSEKLSMRGRASEELPGSSHYMESVCERRVFLL